MDLMRFAAILCVCFSLYSFKRHTKHKEHRKEEIYTIIKCRKAKKILKTIKHHIPSDIYNCLRETWHSFELSKSPHRIVHLLGQTAHESGNFKHKEELVGFALDRIRTLQLFESRLQCVVDSINTNITKITDYVGEENADKLTYPITITGLLDYVFDEQDIEIRKKKLLNIVYGMRSADLGNDKYGDGWKYRGRGYLQITGKRNYREITKIVKRFCPHLDIDFVENPDLIVTHYPFITAIAFFHKEKLFELCDSGNHQDVVNRVTKIINSKCHGLEYRVMHTERFSNILGIKHRRSRKVKVKKFNIKNEKSKTSSCRSRKRRH